MRRRLARAYPWLDERLGISSTILPILVHKVPRGLGWPYVLGSATLVAFTLQVVTGIALAMVYVPAPEPATQTLLFITHESLLGRLVRGAHFYGSGAMVTLIFAHVARTFLFGSYKYPRELTWVSGSLLLLLTLAMAFTGQLLRWDQDAFWSIVVGATQAGKTPVVGGPLMQLVLAGWSVGPATLTRFYATHVFLIPAGIFAVLAIHLYLVVRLGISERPQPGQPVEPATYPARYAALVERGEPFFPDSFWRDAVAGLLVTLTVLVLAFLIGPPEIGEPADPTLVKAHPRPDWYFVWYFALLAVVPTAAETLVIIGLPALVGMVLLVLPFLASRGERAPSRRPWAVASVAGLFLAFVALTYHGYRAPWAPILEGYQEVPLPPAVLVGLSPEAERGAILFRTEACIACHSIRGVGGEAGPDLGDVGARLSRDQLIITILRGRQNMPAYAATLEAEEVDALVAFLRTLRAVDPAARE